MCTRRGGGSPAAPGAASTAARVATALAALDRIPIDPDALEIDEDSQEIRNPLIPQNADMREWAAQANEINALSHRVMTPLFGNNWPTDDSVAVPTTISVSSIRTAQSLVDGIGVRGYIQRIAAGQGVAGRAGSDMPVVYKIDGKHYIEDGNHRVVAAKLMGESTIRARVVDLDNMRSEGVDIGESRLRRVGLLR